MANADELRNYLKKAATELQQARERLREVEARESEPVAIVAMSCRFPGGVDSPERLWELVSGGADVIGAAPTDRGWELGAFADAPVGGFIEDVGRFDAGLFGIAPREALALDPQQRLLLENSWELLERAGLDPVSLRGSRTGVFVGTAGQDYWDVARAADPETAANAGTGTLASVMSGRISYLFGFEGPTMTIDTACSSSLVAMHVAVRSLRGGECSLALAGGVMVMSTPFAFEEFTRQGGLAGDGRCKAFSAAADGTGWSEGVGLVLLERLSDAVRNGRRILAVVKGSAVNSDGASNGMTAPNGPAQQRVIRQALADARLVGGDVDAVEAHGTGTALGDPIEAHALLATYGQGRPSEQPLWLGSIKSNIGHTQAAAGVAGVIKMVMAMRHGTLPKTLHAEQPTPHVDWDAAAMRLLTEARPWPASHRPRCAGVSSFGLSGTNAHMILAEAPPVPDAGAEALVDLEMPSTQAIPWVLSSRSSVGVPAQARRLRDYVAAHPDISPAAIGRALATSRAALECRAVLQAEDRAGFLASLDAVAAGRPALGVALGQSIDGKVAFLFPGQGAQWAGMGRELLATSAVFAARIDECAAVLDPMTGWSLRAVLAGNADSLSRVDIVQPVSFAVMVALAAVWESHGVTADIVVGHSQGEIAAACVAGALSLADAAKIVVTRSRVIAARLSGRGAMVSIALAASRVQPMLDRFGDRLAVAAVNGPASTVISGDATALDEVSAECVAADVRVRRIEVDYASHSAQVDDVAKELTEALAGIAPRAGHIPVYSTVRATQFDGTEMDTAYWVENLREPVQFAPVVDALLDGGYRFLIEVSSHPVLVPAVEQAIGDKELTAVTIATLRRGAGGRDQVLAALAQAWAHGVGVDWMTLLAAASGEVVDLPTYAFQRTHFWPESAAATLHAASADTPALDAERATDLPSNRFTGLSAAERSRALADLVLTDMAAVLGYESPEAFQPRRTFQELGFDSLSAVRFRNRLTATLGLRLPATLVFDYPTRDALVGFLDSELTGATTSTPAIAASSTASHADPIVIVSASCRYPGGIANPSDLWRAVLSETDAISDFPADRGWDAARLAGLSTSTGGFLRGAADFDAGLFGISPREALAMDPQQRLLLESSWELFERAGIDPLSLRGSATGVFIGLAGRDYGGDLLSMPDQTNGHLLTGVAGSVASGRISYVFGLEGPAVTIDTACSSSLVALHSAVGSVRNGECERAIAGGATVMSTPGAFVEFSRQGGLSQSGRCKSFAAGADGTGWGEGVGLVLVERLSEAQRLGHRVLAVVRGSAVNQDGASNGLTAPNGPAQQRVIRQALANAGLTTADVDVVEAHGTGTVLGDPIEAQALLATYGQDRDQPLWLGSIKSNIGHTQAAAGVAGVIKMVEALRHGVLPKTLHMDEPTPQVDWTAGAVQLLTEPQAWPEMGRPRRAAVSSFGISGTNVHVILEQAPDAEVHAVEIPGAGEQQAREPLLPFVFSGNSPEALRAQAGLLRDLVHASAELDLADLAWSLTIGRASLDHRAVVVARDRDELLSGAAAVLHEDAPKPRARPDGRLAFVFSGQGSQRVGMGRELYETYPEFASAFDEVCAEIDPLLGRSLRDIVFDESASLDRTEYAQPGLLAFGVASARLLESWGIVPDAVLGHSVGEIVAACVAGAVSVPDAARMVVARGRLMQALPPGGAMAAVQASVSEIDAWVSDTVCLAAINGPDAVVLSGARDAVEQVVHRFTEQGRKSKWLAVSHAFHSALLDPMLAEFETVCVSVQFVAPRVTLVSNTTGRPVSAAELGSPNYWSRHARETVRFADGVNTLVEQGITRFVEVGPEAALAPLVRGCLPADDPAVVVAITRASGPEPMTLLSAVTELFVHGVPVSWERYLGNGQLVELPTYPFQRQRYWAMPVATVAASDADTEFWNLVELADLDQLEQRMGLDARLPLGDALPAMAQWRRRQQQLSTIDGWAYRLRWTPATDLPAESRSGSWLVVLSDCPAAERVAELLTGPHFVPVVLGLDDDRAAVAQRLRDAIDGSIAGVVSLLALDDELGAKFNALPRGLAATVTLAQALADVPRPVPLWIITQDAVAAAAGDTVTGVNQATLWGLARVLPNEYPDRWGGIIDLPKNADAQHVSLLGRLFAAAAGPDQFALRGTELLARRMERAQLSTAPLWEPTGTVLVTGGTGALGAHVARWLVDRGADHVLLTSRRGMDAPGARDLHRELRERGAEVSIEACDISDPDALAALLDRRTGEYPLTGVVHAAGLLDDCLLDELTADRMDAVLRTKLLAATNLDAATRHLELDAFVLFSSAGATFGALGQGNYAPGNTFLDALAARRRAAGLPATSIAWGPWAGAGMGESARELAARNGSPGLTPGPALDALQRAVRHSEPHLVIADVRWSRLSAARERAIRRDALFSVLPEVRESAIDAVVPVERSAFRTRIETTPPSERRQLLLECVRRNVTAVLGHTSPSSVSTDRALRELGLDSLGAMELRNRLVVETGVPMAPAVVFDRPTVGGLAQYLLEHFESAEAAADTSVLDQLERLGTSLAEETFDARARFEVAARLRVLAARCEETGTDELTAELESASDDDLFDFIRTEFGKS
ncbi:type I polyketide synthase [Nocardia sp. NPDC046473]|uniref:type I polyketide synthase n=1 Tax=Nocardia sp. NPDC046473 TaxID=3155733 RepID=UPI0033EFC0E9